MYFFTSQAALQVVYTIQMGMNDLQRYFTTRPALVQPIFSTTIFWPKCGVDSKVQNLDSIHGRALHGTPIQLLVSHGRNSHAMD